MDYLRINESVTDDIMRGAASSALPQVDVVSAAAVVSAVSFDAECAVRVAIDLHDASRVKANSLR